MFWKYQHFKPRFALFAFHHRSLCKSIEILDCHFSTSCPPCLSPQKYHRLYFHCSSKTMPYCGRVGLRSPQHMYEPALCLTCPFENELMHRYRITVYAVPQTLPPFSTRLINLHCQALALFFLSVNGHSITKQPCQAQNKIYDSSHQALSDLL